MNSIVRSAMWIAAFRAEHLTAIELQAAQAELSMPLRRRAAEAGPAIEATGMGWTAIEGTQPVMSAGILPQWPGRAVAWALVGKAVPRRRWPRLTRIVRQSLEDAHAAGYRRIEATVVQGHDAGLRWMKLLGFRRVGLLRAYDPFGNDHWLFERVRP
jgi:hypothetical protein